MSKQLNEPILADGIRNTYFFNGRLLTADDLKNDQQASREQRWQLGRAIGNGVIEGFEVSLVSPGTVRALPVVAISKGLALNRKGQILSLPDDDQVTLVRRTELPPPEAGIFGDCGLPTSTVANLANGAYLLMVGPASGFQDKVPMRSVQLSNVVAGCGSKYAVEGVQFGLVRLDINSMPSVSPTSRAQIQNLMNLSDDLSLSKLRNLLAHLCFGTEELLGIALEPFKQTSGKSAYATYGALDFMLSRNELTDCQVPLALIYWMGGTVRFVDMWSARRRVFTRADAALSHFYSARRLAETEARFYQFHDHVRSLIGTRPNPSLLNAADAFRFLPAAGLIPLRTGRWPLGVSSERFFLNKSFGPPTSISGDKLQSLFHESLFHQAIDLTAQESIQLYLVSENTAAQRSVIPPQPFVVFAGEHLPYISDQPRFPGLCQTLKDCYAAYHALIGKNIFFPQDVSGASIPARLAVQATIQNVAHLADERYAAVCKCGCAVGFRTALDLLRDIYAAQKELVSTFLFNWPGLTDTASLHSFANQLHSLLDVAIPSGRPSLNQALIVQDLKAAIEAQDVINGMVQGTTGGGAATTTGNLQVIFRPGTEGTVLILGSTEPVKYIFSVRNGTNQAQTVLLNASFLDPHTDWNSFLEVLDMDDNRIPFVTLQSGQSDPTDPNTFQDVQVSVTTPTDATRSDTATLRLTASVPSVHRSNFDQISLTFGDQKVAGTPTIVRFSDSSPRASRPVSDAKVNTQMTLLFEATFHTPQAPPTRAFVFHVIVTTPATRESYDIEIDRPADPNSTSLDIFTQPFNLTSDSPEESITVGILPLRPRPGALPGPLTFTASLRNVDDPAVRAEKEVTITVTP